MKRGQNIGIWIVVALLLYNLYVNNTIKTDVQQYENTIDNLQTKVEYTNNLNKQLDLKIDSIHRKIQTIDLDIVKVTTSIETIKKNTYEKANNVDEFTYADLQKFFTDRYNKKLNSTN